MAVKVGGKDGKYDKASNAAAVQVQSGMLVVFELSGPDGLPKTTTRLEDILAGVIWAPDL